MSKSSITTGRSTSSAASKLAFSAMGIALSMITSYIKIWDMPMGGSVTLLSMFFICYVGYCLGPKYGLLAGAAYGVIQFIVEPYMYTIPQVLLDYPLAFGALGLSGMFHKRRFGLQIGFIVGVLGRFVCSLLSGVIFFASYAPEGMNPWVYSALYQGSYMGTEALLTLVVISLPPVSKALSLIKARAVS